MSEIVGSVRGSSWGDLFDCGYRWYGKNILGVRLPSRGAMVIGSAIHRGSDVFDRAVMEGKVASVDAAVEAAAAFVKDPRGEDDRPDEVDWTDDDEKITKGLAIDYAVKLTSKYCREIAPDMEYTAIEVRCTKLDVTTDSGIVRLTGQTDRIVRDALKREGIADFKSGGKAVEGIKAGAPRAVTKGHQMQLGAYTLMSEAELGRPLKGAATIVGFQTSSSLHIASGTVEHPKAALVGTHDKPGMIELAAKMLKSGVFPPNPKSILCSRKWCPMWDRCPYHE